MVFMETDTIVLGTFFPDNEGEPGNLNIQRVYTVENILTLELTGKVCAPRHWVVSTFSMKKPHFVCGSSLCCPDILRLYY